MFTNLKSIFKSSPTPKFNLVMLGAQKCGTTSLHQALNQHPNIFFTQRIKEPGYFLPFSVMLDYYSEKKLDLKSQSYYLNKILLKGYQQEKIFGEASTFYTTLEWSTNEIADKMYSHNPDMKFIYVYRNPIDRIVSHFFHEKAKNPALQLDTFLNMPEVFGISLYTERLKVYTDKFPKNRFHIIDFDALIKFPQETLNSVFSFLKVAPHPVLAFSHLNQKSKDQSLELKLRKKLQHHQKMPFLLDQFKVFSLEFNQGIS